MIAAQFAFGDFPAEALRRVLRLLTHEAEPGALKVHDAALALGEILELLRDLVDAPAGASVAGDGPALFDEAGRQPGAGG